jgi:SAM-dependent methyltransferase
MAASPPTSAPGPTAALYDALASVYDRWQAAGLIRPYSQVVLAKLLPELHRHARAPETTPSPALGSFVDLGCGTGELLLGLARAHPGWRLLGIDGSAGMLDVARGKAGADRVQWIRGAMTAPPSVAPPLFDAAGCFYDALNHLTSAAELHAAMRAAAGLLRPGGLFVFDATNELGFERWWRGNRTWRGPGWGVAIETRYHAVRRVAQAEVTIDDGDRRTHGTLEERFFTNAEIRSALAAAGFDEVLGEPWSPFDLDAPGKTWWIGRIRRR